MEENINNLNPDYDESSSEETSVSVDAEKKTESESSLAQKPSYNKKSLLAGLAIIVLAGCGYFVFDQAKRNEAYQNALESISLSVLKETLDYADSDPVETLTLISANGDVTADVKKIQVNRVGKTTVVYTVEVLDSYGRAVSKEFEQEFEVVDNVAPEIELSDEEVSIYAGEGFKAEDCIMSVKDPVDGEIVQILAEEEKPADKGWYDIESNVDSDTPGNYTVKIHAEDKNGNKTDKSIAVTVNERPVAATPVYNNSTTYAAGNSYSGGYSNTYSDYSNNENSYVAEAPAVPSAPTETYVEPSVPAIDYSIPAGSFSSYDAAMNWAMGQLTSWDNTDKSGFNIDAGYTAAGVEYWVVSFY